MFLSADLESDLNECFVWYFVSRVLELEQTSVEIQLERTFSGIAKILFEVRGDLLFCVIVGVILRSDQLGIDKSIDPLVQLYPKLF